MKKFILSIFLVLVLASPSWAALSASTVWEYQADATASNLNGGGFVAGTGTDYTQFPTCKASWTAAAAGCAQTSPVNSTNDLASAGDWLTVTSATGGFSAAMVGNLIHITAATGNVTAGWYQILTRADTNTITVDRATGTGNWTAGTGYVGGALNLPTTASMTAMVAGNKAWIKSGTYTLPAAHLQPTTNGTNTAPMVIEGYKTTRGDKPTSTDRPTLSFGNYSYVPGQYYQNYHIIFSGTADIQTYGNLSNIWYNCKMVTTRAGAGNYVAYSSNFNWNQLIGCELISNADRAFDDNQTSRTMVIGCTLHNSGNSGTYGTGLNITGSGGIYAFNLIYSNRTNAIKMTAFPNFIIGNTLYGAETPQGTGIAMTSGYASLIMNNIIYGFATGISNSVADLSVLADYNDIYNCTTPRTNVTAGAHDIALDPQFVSPSTGDLRIGSNLMAKGFPGDFGKMGANPNSIGLMDIGAIQGWTFEQFAPTLRYYYGTGYPRFCN